MKKLFLAFIIVTLTIPAIAQPGRALISRSLRDKAVRSEKYNGQAELPLKTSNTTVSSTKNVTDDVIGGSRYDNQTNGCIMSRIYLWPDNAVTATWIYGELDAAGYSDRGTGYNYYNGTTWNAAPTARVETTRTGWTNVNPWNGNGEINFAHNSTATLIMNTRPVRGTGAWTQSTAPTGPTGVTALLWPSVITSGSNHQYVHVLAIGQSNYQGLSDALLYFRSLDGGVTWDKQGIVLPGMTSADGSGYTGDDYTWAAPHGDTIAFVVVGSWSDGYVMKSFDNGATWTKKVFFNNPYKMSTTATVVPVFWCSDGSGAIQLDNTGKAHVAFGRMRVNCDGTSRYYYPGTDGLVYWNESMPVIDTTRLSNLDTLDAHHQLVGYVATDLAGDSIVGFPKYGVGLSSFPRIVIDPAQNIYFIWSGITVGNPDPTPLNYRHIWGRVLKHSVNAFRDMVDWNAGFLYIFQEFVYPATAARVKNNSTIPLIFQTSSQPGSNIQDTTIPVHDVSVTYRELTGTDFFPVGIDNNAVSDETRVSQVYPNPVTSKASFNISLARTGRVSVKVTNLAGNQVMYSENGSMAAGAHAVTLDCSSLAQGFYLITVNIDGQLFTQRMVRE